MLFQYLQGLQRFSYPHKLMKSQLTAFYSVYYEAGRILKRIWKPIKDWIIAHIDFVCLVSMAIFLGIIYNNDLYHVSGSYWLALSMRYLAGFTGNIVLIWTCYKFLEQAEKMKLHTLGRYTLEIYAVHIEVCGLMTAGKIYTFFEPMGFVNFIISMLLTVVFTFIIVQVFRHNKYTNLIFFGKIEGHGRYA